jgi:ABC-type protease/lipase transport system fused ATPase/permease subunit
MWRQLVSGWVSMRRVEAAYSGPSRPVAMRLPRPTGNLVVDQVTYAPLGATRPVLQDVSFAALAGEAIGIVGASAAGKSTLVRLIVGAGRPTGGVVRLDGADTYSWDRFEFGRAVGYVPQSVDLFDGSIKENIARFRDADSAEIVEAARLAGIHNMILDLPDGYETHIGATGAILSGGQRQRIAHARAVFGSPALVVLDEPSSSLDGEGETALVQMLAELKARRATVLLIAHRPSMLLSLDKILVLTNGRAAAFGPTQQIMPQIAPGFVVPLPRKIAAIA